MNADALNNFRQAILSHYEQHPRDFRWRRTTDPYEILVSEIMLQQTQTERVVPKYDAWLEEFPTAESLAEAPLSLVLQRWIGLGYNRRARFLQQACRKICSDFGGVFPKDAQTLDSLPGIGPYTARAVATFAFGSCEVFIETNIRSVFIFFFFQNRSDAVHDNELLPLIEQTLYRENPRLWYYALMDYGAELKKKVKNPNRNSVHYIRQSKFEGSLRQARGAILRILCAESGGASLAEISEKEGIPEDLLGKAAAQLCAEGFMYASDSHPELYVIK